MGPNSRPRGRRSVEYTSSRSNRLDSSISARKASQHGLYVSLLYRVVRPNRPDRPS